MNIATRPSANTAARALRLAGAIAATYLALTVLPALGRAVAHRDALPFVLHVVALELVIACATPQFWIPRVVRDWAPIAVGPFLYIELRWLIEALGRTHADATVVRWEHALFGGDPSRTWALALPNRGVSELLHLCYASYYLLVLVPPLVLYRRGRREDFARTVLALAMVYAACFATYLLFPVDGPRYLVGAAHAPEGPIRSVVLHLLAAGSSRGTAFPSSHVAASVVAALCALRADRRVGIPVAVLTAGLTVGTVYGGFHYAVDALAGLATGVSAWGLSVFAWGWLSRRSSIDPPGTHSATAA